MRILWALVRKEFLQIFRDRATVFLIFFIPVTQLLILTQAATFEIRRVDILVVDEDRTSTSTGLVPRLEGNANFRIIRVDRTGGEVEQALRSREATVVLRVPAGFERDLRSTGGVALQLQVNSEEGATAGIVQAGVQSIVADYAKELSAAGPSGMAGAGRTSTLDLRTKARFNPTGSYKHYMVPGLLVSLTTLIGLLLTAQNITREKELGTLDQLNVTPIGRWQVITAKLLPFWILGLVIFSLGLGIGAIVYGVPMRGSLLLVYAAATGHLLVSLGLGLLISTVTETQQQAMFVAFAVFLVFLLMSGLFTPIDGMPEWAQWIAAVSPVKHFVALMRAVLLRGADWRDVGGIVAGLFIAGIATCTLAIVSYRKGSE